MKTPILTLLKKITCFAFIFGFVCSYAQITSYPYIEDFEAGSAGWSTQGVTTTWALGNPSSGLINFAASGSNAWVTNLSGDYLNFENGWVESPVFDFSALTSPATSFSVFWNCEFSFDGAVLQSSIDSGASWQNVGTLGDPNNWYNDDTISGLPGEQLEGWSGINGIDGSPGWVVASHGLSNLSGESSVIFRMAFGSDISIVGDGVAFDLIKIYDEDCYAGSDITWGAICATQSTGLLDLNTLTSTDATPNGTWESENNLIEILENNQIDLSTVTTAADYNFFYTVSGAGGCEDVAVITLEVDVVDSAGDDSVGNFFCTNPGTVNLNNYLNVSPSDSGQWESLDGLTIEFDSDVVDFTGLADGLYQFTYIVYPTFGYCSTDQADIQITLETISAGEDGQLAICDDTNFTENDLFNALDGNPDPGGFWFPSITGYGIYTYEHPPGEFCDAVFATVEVIPLTQPSAGTNGVFEACDGFATLDDLFFELGGNPDEGGVWEPDDVTCPGKYTYTHPATSCTVESSAEVEIVIPEEPDAGPDVGIAFADFGTQNLNAIRDAATRQARDITARIDPGIWVQIAGDIVSISEDGEVDFPNNGAGAPDFYSFEYRVSGDCEEVFATMDVEVEGVDTPGISADYIICPGVTFTYTDLFNALGGNPSTRGSFIEPINGPGVYTYEIIDFEDNPGGQSTVTVIENEICDLSIKVFLQGAAMNPNSGEENLMRDDLRVIGLIPTTSPYLDAASCDASVFSKSGPNAIVDWVWLELRDKTDNTIVLNSKSALLQRDGDIVGTDGVSPLSFGSPADNYFVVVSHKTHIGIISASTIFMSDLPVGINFSDGSTSAFGSNAQTSAGMPSNVFGLWAGDWNGDGQIQNTDKSNVRIEIGLSGYFNSDLNLNGQVQNTDVNIILNPNLGIGKQFSRIDFRAKRREN